MAKRRATARERESSEEQPAAVPKSPSHRSIVDCDEASITAAIERLTSELRVLRNVMDEIREDLSWLSRNGLTLRPIQSFTVKRMALDPSAADWGERLHIERYSSAPAPKRADAVLDAATLDEMIDSFTGTLEAVAQGQLEVVLTALDGVRSQIMSALKRRPTEIDDAATLVSPVAPQAPLAATEKPTAPLPRPPPGQLF